MSMYYGMQMKRESTGFRALCKALPDARGLRQGEFIGAREGRLSRLRGNFMCSAKEVQIGLLTP